MYDANNPVIVIANGEFPTHEIPINYLKNCNHIICADGAADKIKEFGLEPNVVIGDFDSTKISSKERLGSWIETPDQNKTDLEKTFEWCISKNIKNITLLGAGGLREDHFLGNLYIVSKFYDNVNVKIITNHSKIICIRGSKKIKTKKNQDISFIASELINNIKITGLKYSLTNEQLIPSSMAISNKSLGNEFHIESTGKVFVFLNHLS